MANKRRWRRIERIMGEYYKLPKEYSINFRKKHIEYSRKKSERLFRPRHENYADNLFVKIVVQDGKRIEKGERVLITGESYCNGLCGKHAKILKVGRKLWDGTHDVEVYGEQPHTYRQTVLSTDIKKLK